ncbi:MAG: 3-phosphoglycerate dehydrogenase [Methylocystis sp.]|nr:3-phosphoglycerate dehydrogenase [Methylocystis sp.]MCA3583244.1 3-phosphoglycerate dehydrogenase [Methylocystis sp.]MCA3587551.1 3-phosphoglycerate dehydrogenase [Methylocystis sp.]MCA3590678.1 3-phosphoglycerate dehydrogenase [Methylocystis sp.]
MTLRIVLLDMGAEKRAQQMRALLPEGFSFDYGTGSGEEAMMEIIRDADFAIAGQVAVNAAVLGAARKLKLLHKWGVGIDNIDIEAARRLGIRVARTTGSNAVAVAEFSLAMILMALRFPAYGHHKLMGGEWRGPSRLPGEAFLLSGKTVGIVGLGAIGQNLARLLRGFGCRVLYAKRTRLPPEEEAALGVIPATIDEIITQADVISLNCPLTPETANLFDAAAFARMKPNAVLINAARGGVVVEADLADALRRKVISAAAMDVFSVEPLPPGSPLIGIDNLTLTPHLAASTADTFEPTVRRMFANMERVAKGEPIPERDAVV